MKIILVIIVIIVSLTHSLKSQYTSLPTTLQELKTFQNECQRIKNIKMYSKSCWKYELRSGTVTDESFVEKIVKYNSLGNIKEIQEMEPDNTIRSITTFKHNPIGLPTEEATFNPSGRVIGNKIYEYYTDYTLKKITENNNGAVYKTTIIKDTINYTITKRMEIPLLNKTYSYQYVYNKTYSQILVEKRYINDTLKNKIEFEYDSVGKINREYWYNNLNMLMYRLEHIYNNIGKHTEEVFMVIANEKRTKKYIYKFDDMANTIGSIEFDNKGNIFLYYKYTFEYN